MENNWQILKKVWNPLLQTDVQPGATGDFSKYRRFMTEILAEVEVASQAIYKVMKRKTKRSITVETWTETLILPASAGDVLICENCGAELTAVISHSRDLSPNDTSAFCAPDACTVSKEKENQ